MKITTCKPLQPQPAGPTFSPLTAPCSSVSVTQVDDEPPSEALPKRSQPSPAVTLPADLDTMAPDGSEVRLLARTGRASMAHFHLAPGQVAIGMVHRTVDEIWLVSNGKGRMWRCPAGRPDLAVEDELLPGVSIPIPVGTHFQFRAAEASGLDIAGVTVPPWPGEDEAVRSEMAPWQPNV
jgi:mannose-6-phosphate isomerase-like protein (cupin superfamily)